MKLGGYFCFEPFSVSISLVNRLKKLNLPKSYSSMKIRNSVPEKEISYSKEVYNYAKLKCPDYINHIPLEYCKRAKIPAALFIIDSDISNAIADAITPHLKSTSCVLELNPGLGFLTKFLLQTVPNLRLYEANPQFLHLLKRLQNKYEVQICNKNFLNIDQYSKTDYCDNGNRVAELLAGIPQRQWDENVGFAIIGAIPNKSFIRYLVRSFMLQNDLMRIGRPELYFCISPSLYELLTATPNGKWNIYCSLTVAFQIIFDIQLLRDDIPRKGFIPWPQMKTSKMKSKQESFRKDAELLYLVRIVGKTDIMNKIEDSALLISLWNFIRHYMTNRKKFVIPTLELTVPDCGPRLIMKGYTIYTQFGNLTPRQVFDLFMQFRKWTEYNNVSFLPAADNLQEQEKHEVEMTEEEKMASLPEKYLDDSQGTNKIPVEYVDKLKENDHQASSFEDGDDSTDEIDDDDHEIDGLMIDDDDDDENENELIVYDGSSSLIDYKDEPDKLF